MASQEKGKVKFIRKGGKIIPIRSKGSGGSKAEGKSKSPGKKKATIGSMREDYRKELLSKKFEPSSKFRISSEYGLVGGIAGSAAGYFTSFNRKLRTRNALIGGLAGAAFGSIAGAANYKQENIRRRADFEADQRLARFNSSRERAKESRKNWSQKQRNAYAKRITG